MVRKAVDKQMIRQIQRERSGQIRRLVRAMSRKTPQPQRTEFARLPERFLPESSSSR